MFEYDTLTDVMKCLPFSFAMWKFGENEVFVSNSLCSIIAVDSCLVDAYKFVKSMKKSFGSFLNTAVEKIEIGGRHYSDKVIREKEEFLLNLEFFNEKGIYVLSINKIEEQSKSLDIAGMLDQLPVYIWQKDRNLRITYCNNAYAKALETSKEDVVSNNLKLISISKRGMYVDQNLYSSQSKKFNEHVVLHGDRRLLSIEETSFSKDGKSTGIAIDITDKEKIEIEYSKYKKQTEGVLNDISVPMAIFSNTATLVFANNAIVNLFKLSGINLTNNCKLEEILDHMISNGSIIESTALRKYKTKAIELFKNTIEPHCTTVYLKNGNTLLITIIPHHEGGLIFIFDDISDKIELERDCSTISAFYNETLNCLTEGLIVFSTDNKIRCANEYAKTFFNDITIGDGIGNFLKYMNSQLNTNSQAKISEFDMLNKVYQRVEFSELLEFNNGISLQISYLHVCEKLNVIRFVDKTDVVKLRLMNEEKECYMANFNNIKSNLINNISNELFPSIQTISGFSEILLKKYFGDLSDIQQKYCHGIVNSINELSDTINAIVYLSKIEAGQIAFEYRNISLIGIIQAAITSVSEKAKRQEVVISTDYSDDTFKFYCDKDSMVNLLVCLLSRLLKSSTNIRNIRISVRDILGGGFEIVITYDGDVINQEDLKFMQNALDKNIKCNFSEYSMDLELSIANSIAREFCGHIVLSVNEDNLNCIIVAFNI